MPPPEAFFQLALRVLQQTDDPGPAADVKAMQFMLIVLTGAYSPLERALKPSDGVDGLFGPKTTNLVRRFQQGEDLLVDGVVGENTWKRLLELWVARFVE